MQDFEKLGLFYLGRQYDVAGGKTDDNLVLYDSRDLVTHAVCVGMTGSGKTGLCLSLLEEAAIDHIPAIAIDPKGDLSNLLLTFPLLRGEDFAPWINEDEARREGLEPAEFADRQAALWKKGLAEWGEDGARIQKLRDSAEFRIYTPGSQAGIPISILKSFAAPSKAVLDDSEAFGERVATTASSLLGLLGIDADPRQSREHILISKVLADAWKAGENLDLAGLIPRLQNPAFSRVGVIELESFFPSKDRFALAVRFNNLIAAPGFAAWLEGEPLDVDAMLYAADGKPRISIVSIAHLGESERIFFVALLLNQVLGWVRSQPGTTSLRAILYMDEIFGYFPPVANPPTKRPLLTLLKQARAYGLGVVLATQNPVDLDYKGLSNAGTWFIGRLQTERDKLRVLDGLEGASATQSARFDRQEMDRMLSGLGKRTFLMHNVHEDHPEVFQVRWALSYLRGPLTRPQIKQLMDPVKAAAPSLAATAARALVDGPTAVPPSELRPMLPPEVGQVFVPLRGKPPIGATLVYRPMVVGCGEVYFQDAKAGISVTEPFARLAPLAADTITLDWSSAAPVELGPDEFERKPAGPARFESLPASASKAKSYSAWSKGFVDVLYREEALEVFKSPSLGECSKPGETGRAFRVRLQQAAREARDREVEGLRAKFAPKLAALGDKVRRADQAVEREAAQARHAGWSSAVRFGAAVLGAVMGRKTLSTTTINKAGTAMRGVGDTIKQTGDVSRAKENVTSLREQYDHLEADFLAESKAVESRIDPLTEALETVSVKPKKANVTIKLIALAWAPFWAGADGAPVPAWS